MVLLIWQSTMAGFDDMASRPTYSLDEGTPHAIAGSRPRRTMAGFDDMPSLARAAALASVPHSRRLPPSRRGHHRAPWPAFDCSRSPLRC